MWVPLRDRSPTFFLRSPGRVPHAARLPASTQPPRPGLGSAFVCAPRNRGRPGGINNAAAIPVHRPMLVTQTHTRARRGNTRRNSTRDRWSRRGRWGTTETARCAGGVGGRWWQRCLRGSSTSATQGRARSRSRHCGIIVPRGESRSASRGRAFRARPRCGSRLPVALREELRGAQSRGCCRETGPGGEALLLASRQKTGQESRTFLQSTGLSGDLVPVGVDRCGRLIFTFMRGNRVLSAKQKHLACVVASQKKRQRACLGCCGYFTCDVGHVR